MNTYGRMTATTSYTRVANTETNPLMQVVMLYDGAIKFIRLAADDIEAKNIAAKAEHSNRAIDILNYLQGTLDFERGGGVAPTLDKLYTCVLAKMLMASMRLDARMMREASELLVPVRDAWAINASNAQAVPAPVTFPASHSSSGQRPVLSSIA
jgi:flagellar protein FliS